MKCRKFGELCGEGKEGVGLRRIRNRHEESCTGTELLNHTCDICGRVEDEAPGAEWRANIHATRCAAKARARWAEEMAARDAEDVQAVAEVPQEGQPPPSTAAAAR